MAFFCESEPTAQPETTTINNVTELPEYISTGGEQLFEQAKEIGQQEYPVYTDPRVAGFNDDQQSAFQLTRDNVGNFQPALDQAGFLTDQGTQQWNTISDQQREGYLNPYQQGVTDIAMGNLEDQYQRMAKFRDADAVSAGAYGGARHGIRDSLDDEQFLESSADLALKGAHTGYESGAARFDLDRKASLSGSDNYESIAQNTGALGTADVLNLSATGAQQQSLEQASLDTAYGDFLEERNWPYENLNFVLGALQGVPHNKTTNSTTDGQRFTDQSSGLSQAAGAGLAAASIYGSFSG